MAAAVLLAVILFGGFGFGFPTYFVGGANGGVWKSVTAAPPINNPQQTLGYAKVALNDASGDLEPNINVNEGTDYSWDASISAGVPIPLGTEPIKDTIWGDTDIDHAQGSSSSRFKIAENESPRPREREGVAVGDVAGDGVPDITVTSVGVDELPITIPVNL